MVFCFSIFEAVWRSHNFECLYTGIYIIRANLRPPRRRYRGGSSTKKIDNPKTLDTWFFVFRYFQPFSSHATSNFSKYRYIYIITVILQPTNWRQGGGCSTKIRQPRTLLYIIYIYIYILVVPRVQFFWIIYLFCKTATSISPTGWQ